MIAIATASTTTPFKRVPCLAPVADEKKCTRRLKRSLSVDEDELEEEQQVAKRARGLELKSIKTSVDQLDKQVQKASVCMQELRSMVELLVQRRQVQRH